MVVAAVVPGVVTEAMTGVMNVVHPERMQAEVMKIGGGMTEEGLATVDPHLKGATTEVAMVLLSTTEAMTGMVVAHHPTGDT